MSETSLQQWIDDKGIVPLDVQRDEALWVITFGVKEYYLTNEEMEFLITQVQNGAKIIRIKGNVFTDRFLSITLDGEKYEALKRKNSPHKDGFGKAYHEEEKEVTLEEQEKRNKAREKTRETLREKGLIS